MYSSSWGTTNISFLICKVLGQHMHSKYIILFDVQGSFSSITYTQGEGRVECGSTMGIHTICTQLRHWSKGRSFTVVPDVEGNLSEGKRPAVKKGTQPMPQYEKVCNSSRKSNHTFYRQYEIGACQRSTALYLQK